MPHIDLNRHYAQAQSLTCASTPHAFLLALTRPVPPQALIVATEVPVAPLRSVS